MRPGFGLSKLKEMKLESLPELSEKYHKKKLTDLRLELHAPMKEGLGGFGQPVDPGRSVARVLKRGRPKMLFITERDTLYPPEEEEPPEEEGGEKKKKKKKVVAAPAEIKTYLNHKYTFPACGADKKNLDNITTTKGTTHFTLSCFSRSPERTMTQE